jgi:hypothetical protein
LNKTFVVYVFSAVITSLPVFFSKNIFPLFCSRTSAVSLLLKPLNMWATGKVVNDIFGVMFLIHYSFCIFLLRFNFIWQLRFDSIHPDTFEALEKRTSIIKVALNHSYDDEWYDDMKWYHMILWYHMMMIQGIGTVKNFMIIKLCSKIKFTV